jgi:hypothetical protein
MGLNLVGLGVCSNNSKVAYREGWAFLTCSSKEKIGFGKLACSKPALSNKKLANSMVLFNLSAEKQ